MRGVDCGDQMIGYYNIGRQSKKWWRRVFACLVEVASLNAYVLYKHALQRTTRTDYLHFRLALAKGLVGSFRGRAHVGRPRSVDQTDVVKLDVARGHWAEVSVKLLECVVCRKVREQRD